MARPPQEEAKLWHRLKTTAPKHLILDRFEARSPVGVPDVYWTRPHQQGGPRTADSGWLELKSNASDIRPGQRIWLNRLRKHDQNALIIAEYGAFVYAYAPEDIHLDCKIPFRDTTRPPLLKIPRDHETDDWTTLWQTILTQGGR